MKSVGQNNAGLIQFSQRPHDVAVFHVTLRIVIGADNENAGMAAAGGLDEQMQILVIIMVSSQ